MNGTGCDCLHPGYGFLAESPDLASLCADQDIVFIGPTPTQIRSMGNRLEARVLAIENGVPTLPGSLKVALPRMPSRKPKKLASPS